MPSFVAESRRGRRLVGRLERGTDVLTGLADLCKKHGVRAGEIRAHGALEQATLVEYDQRGRTERPPRRFDSPLELLSFYGSAAVEADKVVVQARATLSRERDNGIELLGGQLVAGRVHSLEFVIEVFEDLVLRREVDPTTGTRGWSSATEVGPAEPVAAQWEAPARMVAVDHTDEPAPVPATTWQDVIAAKPEPPPVDPADVDARLERGDFIDHPKFGRLQVERIEGDHEFVSARLRNQRLIRLSLDVLSLVVVGREGEHRVFKPERP